MPEQKVHKKNFFTMGLGINTCRFLCRRRGGRGGVEGGEEWQKKRFDQLSYR